jgi:NadR type nicotinamide-nucleotide adenylyltransferase
VSPRFGVGLVVGKFSPLHRGHEYLLREALAQSERLLCISYSSPEKPRCEAEARRRWFAELFPTVEHLALDGGAVLKFRNTNPEIPPLPDNDASELEHRLFVAQVCLKIFGTAVDAVFTSELYGDGFAAELTRQFRSSGASSRSVEHVLVDHERLNVPISATALRNAPALWHDFLSPVVRASLVRRVCLLGGESSGKTTLTRALAAAFRTTHAEEYGRDLWIERGGELSYDDYLTIGTTTARLSRRCSIVWTSSAGPTRACEPSPRDPTI